MSNRQWIYPFSVFLLTALLVWTNAEAAPPAGADRPSCPTLPFPSMPSEQPSAPGAPGTTEAPTPDTSGTAAQQSEAGLQPAGSYAPAMFGDQLGNRAITTNQGGIGGLGGGGFFGLGGGGGISGGTGTSGTGTGTNIGGGGGANVVSTLSTVAPTASTVLALLGRGTFKIGENESVMPQTRVFVNYNYFHDVAGFNFNRETFGGEWAFLDGNASVGLRVPCFELGHDAFGNGDQTDVGDLTAVFKYALLRNRDTGDVLSTGLAVTAPTGPRLDLGDVPDLHSWIFQPWVGFLYHFGNGYVHAFSSVAFPTESGDVTLWFNDIGLGYYLYRSDAGDRIVSAVVPTLECHFNDPLNHRGSNNFPFGVADVIDLTAGVTLGLCQRSTLALGFVTPLSGPRVFDYEAQVQFNLHF